MLNLPCEEFRLFPPFIVKFFERETITRLCLSDEDADYFLYVLLLREVNGVEVYEQIDLTYMISEQGVLQAAQEFFKLYGDEMSGVWTMDEWRDVLLRGAIKVPGLKAALVSIPTTNFAEDPPDGFDSLDEWNEYIDDCIEMGEVSPYALSYISFVELSPRHKPLYFKQKYLRLKCGVYLDRFKVDNDPIPDCLDEVFDESSHQSFRPSYVGALPTKRFTVTQKTSPKQMLTEDMRSGLNHQQFSEAYPNTVPAPAPQPPKQEAKPADNKDDDDKGDAA